MTAISGKPGLTSDERKGGMRYLLWILKFALFLLAFLFMVKNADTVTVHYYLGGVSHAPLFLVLAVAFGAGVACGLFAGLARIFRQRREIVALKSRLPQTESNPAAVEAQSKLQNEFQA
ncbi:MAG TPA: LapA family protein [Aestuariivirgaceae bacterium]|nr:LapA family protein [Aestuariivirgaceae bacterium]